MILEVKDRHGKEMWVSPLSIQRRNAQVDVLDTMVYPLAANTRMNVTIAKLSFVLSIVFALVAMFEVEPY